jgi:outer membrane protein
MKNCLIIAFLLGSFPVLAQIQFNSFEQVLNYADNHGVAIQSAALSEQIALSEKKESKFDLLPSLNVSTGYNDNITLQPTLVPAQFLNPAAPEDAFEELTFGTKYLYSATIQAQWDVLNFQKIFALQTADIDLEANKINTEVNRYNIYHQLASTYYSILLTQESIQIYEENVEVAEAIFKSSKEKFKKGLLNEAELNMAEIQTLQNQRSLSLAENNLEQFYIQLQSQLNTNEQITVLDTPEKFILATTEINGMHPEVLLQEAEVKKFESIVEQTKALRYPSLSLFYQNNNNWATNDFFDFSNANALPQQLLGVQISVSGLFSPAKKQKINQSKLNLELQQMKLANTQLVKQKEDDLLQLQFQQTSEQLAENRKILDLQMENDTHAESRYQGGIISLDQRLDKYGDLLAAQDAYLQSLAAFTLAQYKIYIRQIDFQ